MTTACPSRAWRERSICRSELNPVFVTPAVCYRSAPVKRFLKMSVHRSRFCPFRPISVQCSHEAELLYAHALARRCQLWRLKLLILQSYLRSTCLITSDPTCKFCHFPNPDSPVLWRRWIKILTGGNSFILI